MLSDDGRVYCSRSDRHFCDLIVQLEEIDDGTTLLRRSQSNGFLERPYRTVLESHFRVMGRKRFYDSVDALKKNLDAYLVRYNTERPLKDRAMKSRASAHVLDCRLPTPKTLREEKMKNPPAPQPRQPRYCQITAYV